MDWHKIISELKVNFTLRVAAILILAYPLFNLKGFITHFEAYITGNVITHVIVGQWHIVVISILIFIAFLIPLSYRRKANWVEHGLVIAFFVSLFVEMYGIPLTIMFFSSKFFNPTLPLPPNVYDFSLLGVHFAMDLAMAYGFFLMILGTILITVGWITLYFGMKKNKFVTWGVYRYSRHPQYVGFVLIIYGWLIGWPTILTLIMAPILIYKYITVALKEEKEIEGSIKEYSHYKKKTPFWI